MDFFKSSSSSSSSTLKKKPSASTSSGSKSNVVVSSVKRRVPVNASNGQTNGTSRSSSSSSSSPVPNRPTGAARNALPMEYVARIEAARQRQMEAEAEAQIIRRGGASNGTGKRRKRPVDDFISDDGSDGSDGGTRRRRKAGGKASSSSSSGKSAAKASRKPRDDLFGSDDDEDDGDDAAAIPSSSSSSSRRATPQQSVYTSLGRSGVVQPYLVPRRRGDKVDNGENGDHGGKLPPPSPPLPPPSFTAFVEKHGPPISGATLVENAIIKASRKANSAAAAGTTPSASAAAWGPFFKDLPTSPPPRCTLQYPAHGASEEFILLVARDRDEYDPISDLLRSVYVIVKHYCTDEQREMFGELDELETASAAGNVWVGAGAGAASNASGAGGGVNGGGGGGGVNGDASPAAALTPTHVTSTLASTSSTSTPPPPPAETSSILRSFTKSRNRRSGALFLQTVERFNTTLLSLRDTGALHGNIRATVASSGIAEDVWSRIQDQAYARSVAPQVEDLAGYVSFSSNVYGELTPRFMSEIAQLCELTPGSTMVDLGCGVGNLVIQTALQVGCKSVGIEAMPSPASLGAKQVDEARRRWAMWDLTETGGEMHVWEGDFLDDVRIRSYMHEASLVIVNNYAFTPDLNDRLSLLFLDLPEHCKVVSLKPFVPHDFRITERTASRPSAILTVQEREYGKGMVSWTERGGKYYIATVDRSQLERFAEAGSGGGGGGGGGSRSGSRPGTPRRRRER